MVNALRNNPRQVLGRVFLVALVFGLMLDIDGKNLQGCSPDVAVHSVR